MSQADVEATELAASTEAAPVKRGPGRPKGSRNRVSKDAQKFFQRLWKRPDFKRKFVRDWDAGKLSPQMYVMAAQYAWGKPVDQLNINAESDAGPTAFVLVLNGKRLMPDGGDSSDAE